MSRPTLLSRPSSVTTQSKRIVLVTGGNQGIGYEIVKAVAALPNHQVLLGCRDTRKGEDAVASMGAPPNVNPIQLDVTDDESVEHAFLTVEQVFGKLDVLVHNAGSGAKDVPDDSPRRKWDEIMSVNVSSIALLTDKLAPLLNKSTLPKVILISSGAGSIQGVLDQKNNPSPAPLFAYGASKAAVNYLMALYSRLKPEWRVNAVCPGVRRTNLNPVPDRDDTHPSLGAVRVVELVREGPDGMTGTFSSSEGPMPF